MPRSVPTLATAYETMTILVTVKAYPEVSSRYGETVCVAGIRIDREPFEFVRLFPVAYRGLPDAQRFDKYDVIRLEASRHAGDRRRESHRPNLHSLEIVDHLDAGGTWPARRPFVDPLLGTTMCELNEGRRCGGDGASLALVRPAAVEDLTVEIADDWTDEQLSIVGQGSLLQMDARPLERIGHRFRYRWRCEEPDCGGHHQKIVDWELGAAYRHWRRGGDPPLAELRHRWLDQMCAPGRDTAFFVGDVAQYPGSFVVLGTFWPRRLPVPSQLTLELAA